MFPITFIISDNNNEKYKENIEKSKIFLDYPNNFIKISGYNKCSIAYNTIKNINTNYIAYLHNDVFMPDNFETEILDSINKLNFMDNNWGVCGMAGVCHRMSHFPIKRITGFIRVGCCYDSGNPWGDKKLIPLKDMPYKVETLDEMFLMTKNQNNITFDENIPFNHSYGIDTCLQFKTKNMNSYVIPALIHHNCKPERSKKELEELDPCIKYIQNKFPQFMPLISTCGTYGGK
jgi:hypothetical protein